MEESLAQPNLFGNLPQVHRRVVRWGPEAEPIEFPHSAVIVTEQELLERIGGHFPENECSTEADAEWTIATSHAASASVCEHHFGSRTATASSVSLRSQCSLNTCWIESLPMGWLFLLPGRESAWLLAVGGSSDSLLAQSRLVAEQISSIGSASGRFTCHPRISLPLCQSGWLACGNAALLFDPLCGDGAGNATREAILAAAVVRAAVEGHDVNALSVHYTARLLAGFQRHLETCAEYYAGGCRGPWWDEQVASSRTGTAWCAQQTEAQTRFAYRLNGFELEPITR